VEIPRSALKVPASDVASKDSDKLMFNALESASERLTDAEWELVSRYRSSTVRLKPKAYEAFTEEWGPAETIVMAGYTAKKNGNDLCV
jgi:hypothetical protein